MQGFGVISQHEPQRMKVKNYSVNVEEKIQPSIYISRPKPQAPNKRFNGDHIIDKHRTSRPVGATPHVIQRKLTRQPSRLSKIVEEQSEHHGPEEDKQIKDQSFHSSVENVSLSGRHSRAGAHDINLTESEQELSDYKSIMTRRMKQQQVVHPQFLKISDDESLVEEYHGSRMARTVRPDPAGQFHKQSLALSSDQSVVSDYIGGKTVRTVRPIPVEQKQRVALALSSDDSLIEEYHGSKRERHIIPAPYQEPQYNLGLSSDESHISQFEGRRMRRYVEPYSPAIMAARRSNIQLEQEEERIQEYHHPRQNVIWPAEPFQRQSLAIAQQLVVNEEREKQLQKRRPKQDLYPLGMVASLVQLPSETKTFDDNIKTYQRRRPKENLYPLPYILSQIVNLPSDHESIEEYRHKDERYPEEVAERKDIKFSSESEQSISEHRGDKIARKWREENDVGDSSSISSVHVPKISPLLIQREVEAPQSPNSSFSSRDLSRFRPFKF